MPDNLEPLNKEQIKLIKEKISGEGVVSAELLEELVDHFCVAIEEEMKKGKSFESAFKHTFGSLQEDELKVTEMKTKEITEEKNIFYPDLLQSFLIVLAAFLISWVVSLTVQAIALGEENVEVRVQWLEQNYLWILLISNILTLGGPLGYAVWEKRRAGVSAPVFLFHSVPTYMYGLILLIVFFSGFWLEPLRLFLPFFQEIRISYISQLEKFSPLILTLITIFTLFLGELLFRGIILRGLLMTMIPSKAILWSSLLYALVTFPNFAVMFIIGLIQGWIYWKTRSLYPNIFLIVIGYVIHYIAILLVDYPKDLYFYFSWWKYVDENLMVYIPLVVGSFLVTAGLIYYLHRRFSIKSS